MSNLLLLPDEIKLKIFRYLNGIDKIEILHVCMDFHRIGVDRKILEYLDFSYNYNFDLKFHLKYVEYNVVRHLNLNGIYWIPSAELRDTLLEFVNLQSLHVVYTQLSYEDLLTVLNTTNKVRKLAFSLRPDNYRVDCLANMKTPITHLYMTFYSYQLSSLFRFLEQFSELEELWMIESRYLDTEPPFPDLSYGLIDIKLPKINRKIVVSQRCHSNSKLIQFFHLDRNDWEAIINNKEEYNFFTIFEKRSSTNNTKQQNDGSNILDLEQFTTISDIRNIRNAKNIDDIKITGLNLDETESNLTLHYLKSILAESPLTSALKKWRGVSEYFCDVQSFEKPPSTLFKKLRVGDNFTELDDNNLFARFTRHTPQMEDFEIIVKTHRQLFQIDSLKFMVNWKALKHLTIFFPNKSSGKFMIDVLKSCTELTRLKIRDNSIKDEFSGDLCKALDHAKNLKDFSYKRNDPLPLDKLFESLSCCDKIERIHVECHYADVAVESSLKRVLIFCENLVYFFMHIVAMPNTVRDSLLESIQELNLKPKPQQIVLIKEKMLFDNSRFYDLPMFHIEDMVCVKKTIDYGIPVFHVEDMIYDMDHFYSNFIRNSF